MWSPTRETRSVLAFSLAGAVALLGSAMLLGVRRALQGTGGSPGGAAPEFLVVVVAVVLLAAGVLLLGMAGKMLVDLRRRQHVR